MPMHSNDTSLEPALARPSYQHATRATAENSEHDEVTELWGSLPRSLVVRFRPHLKPLIEAMVREIQRTVPAYARPLEGYFGAVLMSGVEQSVKRIVDVTDAGEPPDDGWAQLFRKLGKVEFHEGRSLDALLTAYRTGGRVAWRHLAAWGIQHQVPMSTVALVAEAIFASIDEISTLSIQGYTQAQSESARSIERRRRKLLQKILSSAPPGNTELAELARVAQWQLPDAVALVALEPLGDDEPPTINQLDDSILIDFESGSPCMLTPRPAQHMAQWERQLPGWRACVGPTTPIAEAAISLRLAQRALDFTRRGIITDQPVTWCSDHLSTLCVLSDEFLVRELCRRTLRPLAAMTDKQRRRITDTALAWLQTRGNVPDIAERLNIHPQTVRYRMRKVEEIFCDQLSDPGQRLDLEISLRANRVLSTVNTTEPRTPTRT